MTDRVEQQPADYRPTDPIRLWLRLRAPFAAYRPMQAGALRTTLPAMTYSAAWGLLLNLAGIESRSDDPGHHGTDPSAPCLRLCLGNPVNPVAAAHPHGCHNRLYQQLHGYPVGRSSQRFEHGAHGAKYHIAPVQREILTDLDVFVGIEEPDRSTASAPTPAPDLATTTTPSAHPSVIARIRAALAGTAAWPRHGLPFAGDNNHLFDHIDPLTAIPPAHWFTRVGEERSHDHGTQRPATRLHVGIDRHDSSRTTTVEVAPLATATSDVPATAWVWTPHPPFRHLRS